MIQEDKELLLRDLCSRLPYFTMINVNDETQVLNSICDDDGFYFNFLGDNGNNEGYNLDEIKPYLFPMSSMTEKQEQEFRNICNGYCEYYQTEETIDWLNVNHFDYRGLISKGLAIDATGLNIY